MEGMGEGEQRVMGETRSMDLVIDWMSCVLREREASRVTDTRDGDIEGLADATQAQLPSGHPPPPGTIIQGVFRSVVYHCWAARHF